MRFANQIALNNDSLNIEHIKFGCGVGGQYLMVLHLV